MKVLSFLKNKILGVYSLIAIVVLSCNSTNQIVVQDLNMDVPEGKQVFSEPLLIGEIAETKIDHLAFVGPTKQTINLSSDNITMFLFLKGNANLIADTIVKSLVPESIAIPIDNINNVEFDVPAGEVLHFVQFTKKLSEQDKEDFQNFPDENKYQLFYTRFVDCEPYTEKIKSPNTTSRTVLPADIVPRVSLGTVEAMGPDEVGAHKHPMLDQLFLGLTDNDITVFADDASTQLKEFALLHIPIGSSHWVKVEENKRMNYMWMDFFLTKEGQEWLKTHKPMSTDKK
ncbi:hypothetical protein [Neotamlana laminarinivorans]|uniref:Cupin n=1 Tax=Neotamlana laminarinivorans TaxID=2883124 RepID=A0A9X1I2B3_9FLAO|nr:hypothetical protein [Tamlana laminarinivorans]MCB4800140.1 hypothetical protein [Tamlana laminarinivorans]